MYYVSMRFFLDGDFLSKITTDCDSKIIAGDLSMNANSKNYVTKLYDLVKA